MTDSIAIHKAGALETTEGPEPGGGESARKPAKRRRRFQFRITVEGFTILIVMILIGFAAWHSGTNLLYLIFSILVALYLAHGFLLSLNLVGLKVEEKLPETVTADEPFEIGVLLRNTKRAMPSRSISISHIPAGAKSPAGYAYIPAVASGDVAEAYYSLSLPRRGLHTLESIGISTRYPFGLEERTQFREVHKQILVLPRIYNVQSLLSNVPTGFGDQVSTTRGSGTELYGLREYIPGEHARHVHWRTSVRAQKIMVAEHFREERRQVTLVLNNGTDPGNDATISDAFENAIVLTASLASHFIGAGYEIGMLTADKEIPAGQGASHLMLILRHLAVLELAPPVALNISQNSALEVTFTDTNGKSRQWLTIDSTGWTPPKRGATHNG